ncbi:MAG: hypothetical protein OER95_12745 [Acidimicrobiia bacterium]|nr:hypothetical protein [Acidimicrobiia bacterium]
MMAANANDESLFQEPCDPWNRRRSAPDLSPRIVRCRPEPLEGQGWVLPEPRSPDVDVVSVVDVDVEELVVSTVEAVDVV